MVENQKWETERTLWGLNGLSETGRWSFWSETFVKGVSRVHGVKGSMAMGTVFAMELDDGAGGKSFLQSTPSPGPASTSASWEPC